MSAKFEMEALPTGKLKRYATNTVGWMIQKEEERKQKKTTEPNWDNMHTYA